MRLGKDVVLATDFSEESRKILLKAARRFPMSKINLVDAYELFIDDWCPPELTGRYLETRVAEFREFLGHAEIPEGVKRRICVVSANGKPMASWPLIVAAPASV